MIVYFYIPITQIQLLPAYDQCYIIHIISLMPYPYQLDYFEVNTRHARYHFTPKYYSMYF